MAFSWGQNANNQGQITLAIFKQTTLLTFQIPITLFFDNAIRVRVMTG